MNLKSPECKYSKCAMYSKNENKIINCSLLNHLPEMQHLLLNLRAKVDKTLQGCLLYESLPKLVKDKIMEWQCKNIIAYNLQYKRKKSTLIWKCPFQRRQIFCHYGPNSRPSALAYHFWGLSATDCPIQVFNKTISNNTDSVTGLQLKCSVLYLY